MAPFQSLLQPDQIERVAGAEIDGATIAATLKPSSAEEVAACLGRARDHRIAIVITGAGTQIDCGNLPAVDSIVRLSTQRLRTPLELDGAEGVARLGAGLNVEEVEAACRAQGMTTRLAGANPGATVGGTIAVEPPTPEQAPTRRLRDDLLGLDVALADGSLTRCGGAVVKNVSGFDLVRLYCGSRGSLGAITSANLRLRPLPEASRALTRDFDSAESACSALSALKRAPASALLLPPTAPSSGRVRLVWCLEGVLGEIERDQADLGGDPISDDVWREAREPAVLEAVAKEGEVIAWLRAQPSQTSRLLEEATRLAGRSTWSAALPLSGALRLAFPVSALENLYQRCDQEGWLVTLDQAATAIKEKFDVFGNEPDSLPVMRALKRRFDADGTLAPGRFLGGL